MTISVVIADDHCLIREGLKKVFEYDTSIRIIGEVENGRECITMVKNLHPQILILDINMPVMDGIETLKEIKEINKNQKILILTSSMKVESIIECMNNGADGYVSKNSSINEIKEAIISVINGDTYIQSNLIPMLNNRLAKIDIDKDKIESLTNRELEVLIQIAEGMINKEIAIKLNISERTVKNHISSIFKKIDVTDRTQAAVFAIRNNLFQIY